MVKFKCDVCGSELRESNKLTINNYDVNSGIIFDENSELLFNDTMDFIVYECVKCGSLKNISFDVFIKTLNAHRFKFIAHRRAIKAFSYIDKSNIKEEHGISFCGMCEGTTIDLGYCYNDVISQCVFRKNKLNGK